MTLAQRLALSAHITNLRLSCKQSLVKGMQRERYNFERQLYTCPGVCQMDVDMSPCAGGLGTSRGRSLKQGGFNFGNTGSLLSGINFGSLGLNFQSLDSQVHPLLPVNILRASSCLR